MTPAELTQLEELARKAEECDEWFFTTSDGVGHYFDPAFVTAANPQVILSLIDKLRRAEKLVEALEFYGDRDNYIVNVDESSEEIPVAHDSGKRAREAIAEWRKE